MATHRLPILGASTIPDTSNNVYIAPINTIVTIGSGAPATGSELAIVMPDPAAADEGFYGKFSVPKNYSSAPVLVIRGVFSGTVGATTLGFGFRKVSLADNEAFDSTYDAEQVASATTSGHSDEDVYEETITLTAGNYAVDDDVFFFFYRDGGTDDWTGTFLCTGLFFEYSD